MPEEKRTLAGMYDLLAHLDSRQPIHAFRILFKAPDID
jgi:hypothetical protein